MRTPPGLHHRRTTAIVAAAAIVAGLTSTAFATSSKPSLAGTAAPVTQAVTKSPGSELISLKGLSSGSHTVTLITGDRVKLTESGGHYAVTTEAAHRADGPTPTFFTQAGPDGMLVIPSDATAAVQAGRLDRQLFNVTYLAENGYTDDAVKQVPLIVQYPAGRSANAVRSAAAALPASVPTHDLSSIHASALEVPKAQAGTFWAGVRNLTAAPGKAAALSGGVDKIWLDQKVKADLDVSVPLIGAPTAWAAGQDGTGVKVAILDTGVDTTHPDLAGKVVESKSFVSDTITDGNGHGTHVASTIVGSGAASSGRYKGVAPGARLIIGKVLDDGGSGDESGIIDGMQWAASSGAKVVSMSLGGGPSDGTDPLSQAVNDLTAATGTLFVIAAGNAGPEESTVASPGAADAALTVAATDKSDGLANFSSRGPRLDSALKPDIAAPGVNIVAARAAGTSLGTPVNDKYTTLSGTSMATPHVAGSAAILAQRHPDWKASQLKAALMSTSKDDGFTVYQQGSGRVDIGRADTQQVFATTANLDYGSVDAGQAPATKELTYGNLTGKPVTLKLAPVLKSVGGQEATTALTVAQSIEVPANGTAAVTVTLASADLAVATYTGAVIATDEATGVRLSTPVGLVREPPKVTLTIRTLGPDGNLAWPEGSSVVDVTGDRGGVDSTLRAVSQGISEVKVPAGVYSVLQFQMWIDKSYLPVLATLVDPGVTVNGDTTVTLDARKAQRITYSTPKPSEPIPGPGSTHLRVERTAINGTTWVSGFDAAPFVLAYATPTKKVTKGSFLLTYATQYGPPETVLSMQGRRPIALHPVVYPHVGENQNGGLFTADLHFKGTQTLGVVDVGVGKPADLAGKDLRGKLALLDDDQTCAVRMDRIHAIRDAGGAGILVWPSGQLGVCFNGPNIPESPVNTDDDASTEIGIPYLSLPPLEGRALADRLTHEAVKLKVSATPQEDAPYTYSLLTFEKGRIPASLHYRLTGKDLADVTMELHASKPDAAAAITTAFTRGQVYWSVSEIPPVKTPTIRHQYVGPLYPDVVHERELIPADGSAAAWWSLHVFDRPVHVTERRNVGLTTPGSITAPDAAYAVPDPSVPKISQNLFAVCALCRQGDNFYPFFVRANGTGQWDAAGFSPDDTHLYADGKELPIGSPLPGTFGYTLPKASKSYRLTVDDLNTRATWNFRSGTVGKDVTKPGYICVESFVTNGESTAPCRPERLVFVSYDLGASQAMDNTVRAGGLHRFKVNAYHAPSSAPLPKITGAKLWYSTDDGAHWKQALLIPGKDGSFTAAAIYPRLTATKGAVSLKVEAWDAAGNQIEQTTQRAFNLR
ncbi:S8 family serine peptidase [Kribbella qitaiheensis]|uniref:S8 family serine peptidase n=1 Tax=Kribbella qitaiheensis TaxID=1544730 RepID=A0A7G6X481_9ACTN|nr:S8 family serine peptidase [Kribbella qitaiheensis]QNE21046.1 S8 family serine peptidase [Kribbella qitaiheensis]